MNWINVKDKLPGDNVRVLCYLKIMSNYDEDFWMGIMDCYFSSHVGWRVNNEKYIENVRFYVMYWSEYPQLPNPNME